MRVGFNFTPTDKNSVKLIIFHDENNSTHSMEIYSEDAASYKRLLDDLKMYKDLNDLGEAPVKLNFEINEVQDSNGIVIQGNIKLALELMKDKQLLDKKIFKNIEEDEDDTLKQFIDSSNSSSEVNSVSNDIIFADSLDTNSGSSFKNGI